MKDEVLLEAKKNSIVIRPVENPRAAWENSEIRLLDVLETLAEMFAP